jgi:uncharacterized membrane protein YcaP (DUF421 family)
MTTFEILVRTGASFVVLFIWARILGKKLISQVTFFDFVAGITLGSLTGSIILTGNVPLWMALLALSFFAFLALVLDVAALKSFTARKLINGEPTLIIKDGKILEEGMTKTRLTVDDLLLLLRKKKIFYVDEVDIAFLETDGTVSALRKAEVMPVTRKDLQMPVASRGLPQTFIIDGKILDNSLASLGKDEQWVETILESQGIARIDDVAFAQIDQQHQVYIDSRTDQVH